MDIFTTRAHEGLERDIAMSVWERYKAGEDAGQLVQETIVQLAIDRYRPKIEAALRRAGLPIEDGQDLTIESIKDAINAKTGLDLDDLTPDAIADAMKAKIAAELSQVLGVEVTDIEDIEGLKAQLLEAAVLAVKSGRANKLINRMQIGRIRRAATWARAGFGPDDQAKILGAWYQKKYRRTHRQVWD